jgi:endo-1,4-beta-D-glucanase Y
MQKKSSKRVTKRHETYKTKMSEINSTILKINYGIKHMSKRDYEIKKNRFQLYTLQIERYEYIKGKIYHADDKYKLKWL